MSLFGPVGYSGRSPAQWALLHAGIDRIPEPDRTLVWCVAGSKPAQAAEIMSDPVAHRMIMRVARTLATQERAFDGKRWVAIEPMKCELDSCDEFFTPKGPSQKFCSRQHSKQFNRLKKEWIEE